MRRKVAALSAACILSAIGATTSRAVPEPAAQGIPVHDGFGLGQDFLDMAPVEQRAYAMGLVNGMLLAPLLGAPKAGFSWFEPCVERMTDRQVAAIVQKHLREHPERWHQGLHVLSFQALKAACER